MNANEIRVLKLRVRTVKTLCLLGRWMILAVIAFQITGCEKPWQPPIILPLPESVLGVSKNKIKLNGTWKFNAVPPAKFWQNDEDLSAWLDIQVPGEIFMQGFAISQDVEYPYKKQVEIPSEFVDKKIVLRFDGVYSAARVWVDGVFVKEHHGGFTSWDVDITKQVVPGEISTITVGVTDKSDEIARGSFYAKHNIGGILRDVTLLAVPKNHINRLHFKTDLNDAFDHANVNIRGEIHFENVDQVDLSLNLRDPSGALLTATKTQLRVSKDQPYIEASIPVQNPKLWDAEHPQLYTLETSLSVEGQTVQTFVQRVGIRRVEVVGEQLRVNGNPVKLRGINRHSLDPLLGRTETAEDARADILLFRDANINFIRTSHYPPTQAFLDYADEYGMYLEVETPVTWWNVTPESSSYTSWFMTQFSEMIERDQDHASIVMWSLGNESFWDPNFMLEYNYAMEHDGTRPVIWSNAPPADQLEGSYDIHSEHYPDWKVDHKSVGKPILLEEYAHVPSYEYSVLQRDPNIRNFWGGGLDALWDDLIATPRLLGGAIWSGIDEVFLAPEKPLGYGRWGIIDEWRRQKPEFWLTKKAYSPIEIAHKKLQKPATGMPLKLDVINRFDHTNLNEIEVVWTVNSESGVIKGFNAAPQESGVLAVPSRDWQRGDTLNLKFYRQDKLLVDEFDLAIGSTSKIFESTQGPAPLISENETTFDVTGETFLLRFDKLTGLIIDGRYKGQQLIRGGPSITMTPVPLSRWKLDTLERYTSQNEVVINLSGSYGEIEANFAMRVDANGLIKIDYEINNPPEELEEVGVSFSLVNEISSLSWDRRSYWSAYPEHHIGRPKGTAKRFRNGDAEEYRVKPEWPWSMDMKDYFLFGVEDAGRATNDFRSSKENIFFASAILDAVGARVRAESNGTHSVRMGGAVVDCMVDDKSPSLIYQGEWSPYEDLSNCKGTEEFSNETGASVEYRFYGDSVIWIGPTHHNMGKADVYLDGVLSAKDIDLYSLSKIPQQKLFMRTNLTLGWHTIKVVANGDKNPSSSDSFIVVDGFHFSDSSKNDTATQMNVLNEWAYNPRWGNEERSFKLISPYRNTVKIRLTDSDSYAP